MNRDNMDFLRVAQNERGNAARHTNGKKARAALQRWSVGKSPQQTVDYLIDSAFAAMQYQRTED